MEKDIFTCILITFYNPSPCMDATTASFTAPSTSGEVAKAITAELLREHLLNLADIIGLGQDVLQLHLHLHHILSPRGHLGHQDVVKFMPYVG